MYSKLKKISISLIAILLVYTQLFLTVGNSPLVPAVYAQEEGITLKVGLKDTIHTKSERITFDVWARDEHDQKIDDDYVDVTNNGEDVGINWSDEVKTSYTAYLTDGLNEIIVFVDCNGQQLKKTINVTYEFAEEGEIIGEFTFSMDGFVVGLDYLIEPIKVPIVNGENAAIHLERILADYGFTTDYTGSPENGYYLETIYEGNLLDKDDPPEIPQAILDAAVEHGGAEPDPFDYTPGEYGLGEFDFNFMSGWMYAVNNVFPNVGFADYYLMNDDIMRVQYTIAYGSDIGGGYAGGGSEYDQYFPQVNKDYLTEIVATINSSSIKDILLNNSEVEEAYDNAFEALRTVDASQEELNEAEDNLRDLYSKNKIAALIEVIDQASVTDRVLIELIRYDVNKLSADEVMEITNLSKLAATSEANVKAAKVATDQIAALPSKEAVKISDETVVNEAKTTYEALTAEQKSLVTNAIILMELAEVIAQLKEEATIREVNEKAAKLVTDQIIALPSIEDVKITDEAEVNKAKAAYEALTAEQKTFVTNANILTILKTKLAELKATNKSVDDIITLITNLPEVSSLKLTHETTLQTVKTAYDALTAEQKKLVTNSSKLTSLVIKMAELKEEAKNQELALNVTIYINSLPNTSAITLANKVNVTYARAQYNALTTKQKVLVLNLSKLIDAEAKIAELEMDVKVLINEINSLPNVTNITLKNEAMIQTLRTAYNKLSNSQRLEVSNYTKLVAAEAQITKLKAEEGKNIPEDLRDGVKTSSGIETIKENTKANTLNITPKGKATEIELTFSKELIQQIKAKDVEIVVIESTNDVLIEIPTSIFTDSVSKNAQLMVYTKTVKTGSHTALQVNLTETLSNGIKRDISLQQAYVKIAVPLSTFTNNVRSTSDGVILRMVDGQYRAIPHQIKDGGVIIYSNTNDQYVYTTETVTFKDIAGLGNKEDVEFLAERRIVNGTTAATYNPYKSITRAEFGVMIARALNLVALDESIHKDTKGAWYEREIQTLYEAGITDVTGNFNPNATLTREQAAAFMYRVIQYIEKETNKAAEKVSYKDQAKISPHFTEAIAVLQQLRIMEGKSDGNFDPKGNLTRAQMAKILKRTLQEVEMM